MTDEQRRNEELDTAIAAQLKPAEWITALFSDQETVVALDEDARLARYHSDGTVTRVD